MNALPSLDLPKHPPRTRKSGKLPSANSARKHAQDTSRPSMQFTPSKSVRPRRKINPAYAHRRQGLEVATKLVTYSTLSLFGIVTLVSSIGYNYSQQSKLQSLEIEVQDAKNRTAKVNTNFIRSNDPQSQKNVTQENTYKIAPDRLPIFLINHSSDRSVPTTTNK